MLQLIFQFIIRTMLCMMSVVLKLTSRPRRLSVIFLAEKFVLSMIIRIFAASVLAKPLNNAQIVRGVFCLYTFEYGESYSLYKTV